MNQCWNGDCLELMKNIPDKSIDMILCDLPFQMTNCKWDIAISLDLLWVEYKRLIKDGRVIILNATQPFSSKLVYSNPKWYKYSWIWQKNCPSNIACGNYQPLRYTEEILVFYDKCKIFNKQMIERMESGKATVKQKQKTGCTFKLTKSDVSSNTSGEVDPFRYSSEFKNPSNLIYFPVDRSRKYKHPTKKPVALCEYLLKTYTNENDLVLDNCAGSFTTAIACINTNRNYICIEKDEEYYKMGLKRINDYTL